MLGVGDPSTLTSMSNLASVLQDQGKYEQGEEMGRRALAERKKVLGVDHPQMLTSVYCLAYLLNARQDLNGALKLYQRLTRRFQQSSRSPSSHHRGLSRIQGITIREDVLAFSGCQFFSADSSASKALGHCMTPERGELRPPWPDTTNTLKVCRGFEAL